MHRLRNGVKTAALLGLLSAIILGIGSAFGRTGLVIAVLVAIAMNAYSYFKSDTIALKAMRARPVTQAEQPTIYRIVRELAEQQGQPMPRLYLSPTQAPNAFATGRNPEHAAVCCTEGILDLLDERELRGVLGHELSHVYNRDILISSVAATLASVLMFLANFALLLPMLVGGSDDEKDGGGLAGTLLMMILVPIAASLIQMAISRSREYHADASGAHTTGDPLALAHALRKLDAGTQRAALPADGQRTATSHLMIANPFSGRQTLAKLFSTHPPMQERIDRLQAMATENH